MERFCPINFGRIVLSILSSLAIAGALIQPSLAVDLTAAAEESNAAKNLARMNGGAKVDCITPDGRRVAVPSAGQNNSSAAIMDDDTLRCPLQEGETTFIISFPKTSPLDRFTFVNENAKVKGEMKISVSNYRLPADSPKWTEVNGTTAFMHKRLFNLSMVGVEARYVKLSFHVEKRVAKHPDGFVPVASLATHGFAETLNFNLANL